jgi:LysR family transcriptional regulator for bpeEF and oprC
MEFVNALRVFGEVARHESFTAAAKELRFSTASVSRIIGELENDLGVRLFNRTTRRVQSTDAGLEFLRSSTGVLEEIDLLRSRTRERHNSPRGLLRVSSVTAFGNECLAPAIPGFLECYPGIKISVDISNRMVDLIEEHYDVAIRVGPLEDSSLIAKKIFDQQHIIVATPEYCERFGVPETLRELTRHRSITQISGEWGRVHQFKHGKNLVSFKSPEDCVVSSPSAARNAVLTGYGYTLLPDYLAIDDIVNGRLIQLLEDYKPVEQPIYAVMPHRRYVPGKARVFLDYLVEHFSPETKPLM